MAVARTEETAPTPVSEATRDWVRDNQDMQYVLRSCSSERGWVGLVAALFDTSAGRSVFPEASRWHISMHVGNPVVATWRVDGPAQRRFQTDGDVDVVPPGYAAAWENGAAATLFHIALYPSLVRSVAESMRLDPDRVAFAPQLQVRDPQLDGVLRALKAEVDCPLDPYDRLYAEGLGLSLTVHLLRRYGQARPPKAAYGLGRRQLRRVLAHIDDHLTGSLTIADLSALLGMGRSQFKVSFKQSVGLPVHRYVVQRRVDIAMQLLAGGNASLSDVAARCGFADQSHMARCMRRLVGLTPKQVALSNR